MSRDLIISVVIPTRNNARLLVPFVQRVGHDLTKLFHHYGIIVVDDGSNDPTVAQLRGLALHDPRLRLLALSRRYGREIALTAGIDHSIGDFVIVLPSMIADPHSVIRELIDCAQQGHDLILTRGPTQKSASFIQLMHRLFRQKSFRFLSSMTGFSIDSDVADILCVSRRVVNSVVQLKEQNRYVRMLLAYVGFEPCYVELSTAPGPRLHEASTFASSVRLGLDVTVAFSDKPLRYASVGSFVISAFSLVAAVIVLMERLLGEDIAAGWASLMVVQLVMFCILFFLLAVISEYIGSILEESKHRPLYYLKEDFGGTEIDVDNIVEIS